MREHLFDEIVDLSDEDFLALLIEKSAAYLEIYPRDTLIWFHYGSALAKVSRFEEAQLAFEKALRNKNALLKASVWTAKGHLEQRRGDFQQAEKCFLQALLFDPTATWNHVFLGVLLFQRGDLKGAEERLHLAIASITPEDRDEAYFNLGGVLLAQKRYEEAAQCYRKALELDPEYKLAKIRLADVEAVLE